MAVKLLFMIFLKYFTQLALPVKRIMINHPANYTDQTG